MAYRILLLTEDNALRQSITGICSQDYLILTAATSTQGLERVVENACDLVLLDIDSAASDGLGWLKALRHTDIGRELPVIVLSNRKTDDDLAQAFEWGADDFILKGSASSELLARLRSVLRRRFEREASLGAPLKTGPITLDPSRHECRVRETRVRLNPREFELLEMLMRKAVRVLTRAYLLGSLWGMSRLANTRTVDVAVSRLRKAIGPRAGRWVETVERYGYRFRDPADFTR